MRAEVACARSFQGDFACELTGFDRILDAFAGEWIDETRRVTSQERPVEHARTKVGRERQRVADRRAEHARAAQKHSNALGLYKALEDIAHSPGGTHLIESQADAHVRAPASEW